VEDYPLRPVVEEVAAAHRAALETEGWTVQVKLNAVPGTVSVELEHPLVPGVHGFTVTSSTTPERARRFLAGCFADHYQFDLVRDAPVRPERRRLLRSLRGAARLRASDAAAEAIVSAGYALYEEGILLREEADWLDEAVNRDLEESGPRRGP
jgi:hypothetical protein